jgi:hypothetical protein
MPSPFSLTKQTKALLKSVAKGAWLLPKIFWDTTADIPTAVHNGSKVTTGSFGQGVKALQASLAQKLGKILFLDMKALFALDLSSLKEHIGNCEPAESFVSFNARLFQGLSFQLLQKIRRDCKKDPPFNYRDWFKAVDDLVGPLVTLIHLAGGMPGRATEYVPLLSRNDGAYRQRSVFLVMGRLCFVFDYNKAQSQSSKYRVIPRFLDSTSSLLWVWYLGVIQPMYW